MVLTPSDVQQKTFGPELRGYNMDEVDDFLDEIVATLTDYERRLAAASDRARRPEVAEPGPTAAPTGPEESVISRTLVTAQQAADSLLEKAQGEADTLVGKARADSDDLKAGALAERERTLGEIERLRGSVGELRSRLSDLARSVDEDLVAMETAIEETSPSAAATSAPDTDENETTIAEQPTTPAEDAPSIPEEEVDVVEDETTVPPEDTNTVEDPEETIVIERDNEEGSPDSELAPGDDENFGEFDPWGDTTEQEQMELGMDEDEKPRRPWER